MNPLPVSVAGHAFVLGFLPKEILCCITKSCWPSGHSPAMYGDDDFYPSGFYVAASGPISIRAAVVENVVAEDLCSFGNAHVKLVEGASS